MEYIVETGKVLLLFCITQFFCTDHSKPSSPIATALANIFNIIILLVEVAIIYVLRVYFGEEGLQENKWMNQWICTSGICEIVFVYKIVGAIVSYHVTMAFLIHIAAIRTGLPISIYNSYWSMKCTYQILLLSLFFFVIPETIFTHLYWVYFVIIALFLIFICFSTLFFAYGSVQLSAIFTNYLPIDPIPEDPLLPGKTEYLSPTTMFQSDQVLSSPITRDVTSANNGKLNQRRTAEDIMTEYDDHIISNDTTIDKSVQQFISGTNIPISMTSVPPPNEYDIGLRTSHGNYYAVMFYIMTLVLIIYSVMIIIWLVQMVEEYSNCHINAVVLFCYGLCIFLSLITVITPQVKIKVPYVDVFIFSVILGISSYFLWNVAVLDDPMNCTKTVYVGEGIHIFTIVSFLVFFVTFSIFSNINQTNNPSEKISKSKVFHLSLAGCFCYLSFIIIDWGIPVEYEDVILQEKLVIIPLIFHSVSIVLIFALFALSVLSPLCFECCKNSTPSTTISSPVQHEAV